MTNRKGSTVADVTVPGVDVQHSAAPGDKGLKTGALGFMSSVVIGVASTAPGYSLAASLGVVAAAVALQAPAALLIAFVPMFLIAGSYYSMNRVDPDCGTTFTWVTKGIGPGDGMDRRLGAAARGHPRHGEPVPDRRPVHIPALRRGPPGGQHVLGDRDRRHLDRRDDVDLLHRHRALGPHAVLPPGGGDRHAGPLRGRRPDQGLQRRLRRRGETESQLDQPVRRLPRTRSRPAC